MMAATCLPYFGFSQSISPKRRGVESSEVIRQLMTIRHFISMQELVWLDFLFDGTTSFFRRNGVGLAGVAFGYQYANFVEYANLSFLYWSCWCPRVSHLYSLHYVALTVAAWIWSLPFFLSQNFSIHFHIAV